MSHRASTSGLIAVALLAAASPRAPARAADLDYGFSDVPPPIAESKVEFGSGWYVRGDIGATRLPSMNLDAPTATGQVPTVSLGSGSKLGYTASLGAGYAFNKWFRSDVIADFHQPISVRQYGKFFGASTLYSQNDTGTCQLGYAPYLNDADTTVYRPYYENCSSNYQGSVTSYDVLVNGYVDLGHWYGVTPYVGAGVGIAFGHYLSATTFSNPDGSAYNTYFTLPGTATTLHGYNDARVSGNYYNFAFAATAGIAIDIYAHTKLDINYRYLHLGEVLGASIATQEVRAGVRYMIDN